MYIVVPYADEYLSVLKYREYASTIFIKIFIAFLLEKIY